MLPASVRTTGLVPALRSLWNHDAAVVRYEQAVYGSFPFWSRGYAVLAQSPGCRAEWLAGLKAACQRYGEPPQGLSAAGALFSMRLPGGPWMVVGVGSPGADDQGRPGALSFHALFVSPPEFRKVGFNPFALAGALQRAWGPDTTVLKAGSCRAGVEPEANTQPDALDAEIQWTAARLAERRRVVCQSAVPIDRLARGVWQTLPEPVRRHCSVATLAFSTANAFSLVALPRLSGIVAENGYEQYQADAPAGSKPAGVGHGKRRRWIWAGALATVLVVASVGLLVWMRGPRGTPDRRQAGPSQVSRGQATIGATAPPDRSRYLDDAISPEERARVSEGLVDLAERFGVAPAATAASNDPAALMILLAERLRYRGPRLGEADLDRLAREPVPERAIALGWQAQIDRFLADRPLPADFARGPLRWQLDTLAWSFHVDPDPNQSAAEVPHALANSLAVAGPVHSSSLTTRYPALAAYADFLGRLPRR